MKMKNTIWLKSVGKFLLDTDEYSTFLYTFYKMTFFKILN